MNDLNDQRPERQEGHREGHEDYREGHRKYHDDQPEFLEDYEAAARRRQPAARRIPTIFLVVAGVALLAGTGLGVVLGGALILADAGPRAIKAVRHRRNVQRPPRPAHRGRRPRNNP